MGETTILTQKFVGNFVKIDENKVQFILDFIKTFSMRNILLVIILFIIFAIDCGLPTQAKTELISIPLSYINADTLFDGGVFRFISDLKIDTLISINGKKIKGTIGFINIQDAVNNSIETKCRLLVFKTLINGKCFMGFDCNGDHNLTDEKLYECGKPGKVKLENIQIFDGNRLQRRVIYVTPTKSGLTFNSKSIDKLINYGVLISPIYKYGYFIEEGKKYQIVIGNMFSNTYNRNSFTYVIRNNLDSKIWELPVYHIGDTIYLSNDNFEYVSLDSNGEKCCIKRLAKNANQMGIETGDKALPLDLRSIYTNEKIDFADDKYTLLDFWGSWCGPCREQTPLMIDLYQKSGFNKVKIIGIANDQRNDALKYIKGQNIPWANACDSFTIPKICNRYKVVSFPTYILINRKSQIVFRGIGLVALKKIMLIIDGS